MNHIGLVVEGKSDKSVSGLIRRYLAYRCHTGLRVGKPITGNNRGKLLKAGELEKLVGYAASEPGAIAVIVLFDGDQDAACELGPDTFARVDRRPTVLVKVCIAVRTIENWIMGSAETVFDEVEPLEDPEGPGAVHAIKVAKKPRAYNKPLHAPGLLEKIDFDLARSRSPSFDRFLRIIDEIAEAQN